MFSFMLVIAVAAFLGSATHDTLRPGTWPHASGACRGSERAGPPERVGLTAGRRTGINSRAVPPEVTHLTTMPRASIATYLLLIRSLSRAGNRENSVAHPVFRYFWSPRYETRHLCRAFYVQPALVGRPMTQDLELHARAEP